MVVTHLTRIDAEHFATIHRTSLPMELISGKIYTMPAPKEQHETVSSRMRHLLKGLIEGGEVGYGLTDVYLDQFNVLQPDVFWMSGPDSKCRRNQDGHLHGAPDLVVEVVSEESGLRDRREKFRLYEKHGVQEYWLVDPRDRYIEVWQMGKTRYKHDGLFGQGESFVSPALGRKKVEMRGIFGPAST